MEVKGRVSFEYDYPKKAGDVAALLELDNLIAPRTIKIKTMAQNTEVVTELKSKRASTFFSTVEDLMFSEKLITDVLKL